MNLLINIVVRLLTYNKVLHSNIKYEINIMGEVEKLITERLVLRQWKESDYLPFAKMNANPVVMEYYPNTLIEEESNAMADKLKGIISAQSWGFWAVETKSEKEFIGFVGLHKPTYDLPVL